MNNEGIISSQHVFHLLIHDLIKPRKFNCVAAVSRGISSAFPRRAAEFTKFAAEFVKFFRGKLWALVICSRTHCMPRIKLDAIKSIQIKQIQKSWSPSELRIAYKQYNIRMFTLEVSTLGF